MFEVKYRMIRANFSSNRILKTVLVGWKTIWRMYICKLFNREKTEVKYKQNVTQQITFKRCMKCFEEREKETAMNKTEIPHATATFEPQTFGTEH